MTFRRRALALLVAGALTFGLAGCFGQPAAKPSTPAPAFTSDAAAYAAAEKVYREYIEATNAIDYADPKTFEPALRLTTGNANAADRKALAAYHADGVSSLGELRTVLLEPMSIDEGGVVKLAACIDVSTVKLVNPDGSSAADPDRVSVQKVAVLLTASRHDPAALLISDIQGRDDGPQCG
jgi:hypothetical protein